jgi:APA family basic amino acid/polyamine antiporter
VAEFLVAAAGVAGITSVLLVMLLGVGPGADGDLRDGLLPPVFAAVHPTFQTPWLGTLAVGAGVALMAGLLPLGALLQMTNIGTLFAFAVVCTAVPVLRHTKPHGPAAVPGPAQPGRPDPGGARVPAPDVLPAAHNWVRLFLWMALGLASVRRVTGSAQRLAGRPSA